MTGYDQTGKQIKMKVVMGQAELDRHIRRHAEDSERGDALIRPYENGWAVYVPMNHWDIFIPIVVEGP